MARLFWSFDDIFKEYGNDWSKAEDFEVASNSSEPIDLSNVKFPKRKNFIKAISLAGYSDIIMPAIDYSFYDFSNVNFRHFIFKKGTIFPKDKYLFKGIFDHKIEYCKFEGVDLSYYDFKQTIFSFVNFSDDCLIPKDFFMDCDFSLCKLPKKDYRKYKFKDFNIRCSEIPNGSLLPRNFFAEAEEYGLEETTLPDVDMNEFDFENVKLKRMSFSKNSKMHKDLEFFQKLKEFKIVSLPKWDYSKYDFSNIDVRESSFTEDSILPKNFFDVIEDKSVYRTVLPEMDYSEFNLNGVCIDYAYFPPKSKLPRNEDFFVNLENSYIEGVYLPNCDYTVYNFKDILYMAALRFHDGAIINQELLDIACKYRETRSKYYSSSDRYIVKYPAMDYSNFNFKTILLTGSIFPKDSILPKDKDFFRYINISNAYGDKAKFPIGDYRNRNFKDVDFSLIEFHKEALLPEYEDFLLDINSKFIVGFSKNEDDINYFYMTDNMVKNIHNYNINNLVVNISDCGDILTEEQISILNIKYKNQIGKNIKLPKSLNIDKPIKKESNEITL